MASHACCPVAGIGLNILTPTSSPRPLPDLLGFGNDQQLQEHMAKEHSYEFNLGHGKLFKDYKEAAKALMERNMPEVLDGTQTEAIFLPETHLPRMPRILDVEAYRQQKKNFTAEQLEFLEIPEGNEDIDNCAGERVEQEFSVELRKFYSRAAGTKVVILQGPTLRKRKGGNQEFDFVIIDLERKAIICIESKATLIGKAVRKAVEQTKALKNLLEKYFGSELASGEWAFVGMIYTGKVKQPPCADCSAFIIEGSSQLHTKLSHIEDQLKRWQRAPNYDEFASLVQGLVFVALSQPVSTHCTIAGDVHDKVVGKTEASHSWAKRKAIAMATAVQNIVVNKELFVHQSFH